MIAADLYDPAGTGLTSFFSALSLRSPSLSLSLRRRVSREPKPLPNTMLLEIDALVGEERGERHDDAAADRGVPLQLEAVDRRDQVLAVLRGRLHEHRGAGERDDAALDVGRQVLARTPWPQFCAATMRFGSTSVARIDSDTSIAMMIVRASDGSVTIGARARDRDQHADQREQEQERRHVTPEALRRARSPP